MSVEDGGEPIPVAVGVAPRERADEALFAKEQSLLTGAQREGAVRERDVDVEKSLIQIDRIDVRWSLAAGQISRGLVRVNPFDENPDKLGEVEIATQEEVVQEVSGIEGRIEIKFPKVSSRNRPVPAKVR
ncbi:MAG: hypothetical protein ABI217_09680 [Chthoniobacterales bacterium]